MKKRNSLRTEDELWRWARDQQQRVESTAATMDAPARESWFPLRWLRRGLGVKSPKV